MKRDLDDMRNKYKNTITENTKLKEKIDILSKNNNNNKKNINSIPLRTKNLNNQYQQMIEKNQNEIKTLKNSINELKKDIKNLKFYQIIKKRKLIIIIIMIVRIIIKMILD